MSAHTALFDFTIEPSKIRDETLRNEIIKIFRTELENIFPQLKFVYDMNTEDGYMCILSENNLVLITIRFFIHGIITMNIEYYREETKDPKLNYDSFRKLLAIFESKLKTKSGQALPPIRRGNIPRFYVSADERILEYDIDKIIYEERSEFQKIQIVHSRSMGNILMLDELQNLGECDLIYTETLMQRGIENYEGKEICILGGGDGALLYELLKEKPKHVVMLEIDEMVMDACNKYMKSVCGDVLEKRKDNNYEIIVGDCMEYMKRYIKEGKQFDYVFGDLTDIPISDTPTGEIWNFIRSVLEHSFKILKPNGKYMTHGNGSSCPEALEMYEKQLKLLQPPIKYTKAKAYVPSFMEEWVFYQVSFA